ncbi:MAG: hypothetical protein KDM91_15400 [Verrucomicrobiae bacterium]|nr:hypothetical protein [Verrucomicrobiae bacterium]MCP5550424.1 hypothetical protein [Akkermansiaceae bacterium]
MKVRSQLRPSSFVAAVLAVFSLKVAFAQGPPPPPPPQPLAPPAAPAANPVTASKTSLGQALFWDEQLSSTRTVSCGTCHQPVTGGADPRSRAGNPATTNPGPDGTLGTADDITGSPGVVLNDEAGLYGLADFFGMTRQVTGRYAPSAINAGYAPSLFWDGRATTTFRDPVSDAVVIAAGAALESQAAGPPASDVEMAHQNRDWTQIATRVAGSKPLALAPSIPATLESWIADRNYPALFTEAFGDAAVTPARIIMAIATYERTLVSNQSPIDAFFGGDNTALTAQELQGQQIFVGQGRCAACHRGNRFTDDNFHYIGVRPQTDDLGRFNVTGNNGDRGRMKTPSLRNVALRNEFFHNGRFTTLDQVVNFYNRGGDFDAPNKNGNIQPLGLTQAQRDALVAFLSRPLTDPRVEAETGPFARPALFAGSNLQAQIVAAGVPGTAGLEPRIVAIEPPLRGNPNFTLGVWNAPGGADAVLAIDDEPLPSGAGIPDAGAVLHRLPVSLNTSSGGEGYGSAPFAIAGDAALAGQTLFARWYVNDPGAPGGVAESASVSFTVFGESAGELPAPANLSASDGTSEAEVALGWDAVDGAVSYRIFRGASADFAAASLLGATADTAFADTTAETGLTYSYFVVAVSETEAGPASAPDSGSLGLGGVSGLTATDGAHTDRVVVSWEALAGGASLYRVYRGESSDSTAAAEIASTAGTSTDDTTAVPGRVYYYWVRAENGGVTGAFSGSDTGYAVLEAPSGLTASDNRETDVLLGWNAVVGAMAYTVYRSDSDNVVTAEPVGTTAATSLADTSAAADQAYVYWVEAESVDGVVSPWSASVTGRRAAPSGGGGGDNSGGGGIVLPIDPAPTPSETPVEYAADSAGAWWGLLRDAAAPDGEVALLGCASARITHVNRLDAGVATLVLNYEGRRHTLRGRFEADGSFAGAFAKRDADRTPMTLTLQLADTDAGQKLTGILTGDGRDTAVVLRRRAFHRTRNPADAAGRYTLALPADPDADPAAQPGGDGIAAGALGANGVARLLAFLGDGTRTTIVAYLSQDGELAFYRPLYRGDASGWIGGLLMLRDLDGISHADGMLQWVKNARAAERLYPGGFDLQQPAVASRYLPPDVRAGERVLAGFADAENNASIAFVGGNPPAAPGASVVTWTTANRFSLTDGDLRVTGSANVRNGLVGGLYRDDANGVRFRYRAVVFQAQDLIPGHFIGDGETGTVLIAPEPVD